LAVAYRTYALALLMTIAYLTFLAFRYLWISLVVPAQTSQRVTHFPAKLSGSALATARGEWEGLVENEWSRSPLAHYHRLDSWIQPDPGNNCTTSGCHAPLPHNRRKEVRAFLNLHTTSMHCGVCHMVSQKRPLDLTWYDLQTQAPASPPPLLRALALLTEWTKQSAIPSEEQRIDLLESLRQAGSNVNASPEIRSLHDHLAVVGPKNEEFPKLIEHAAAVLPRHMRGEYGRKIAIAGEPNGPPILGHPDTEEAIRRYRERAATADEGELASLLDAVHPLRRPEALTCRNCHADQGLVNFTQLGYPAERVRSLTHRPIDAMIERIGAGQPFHLPTILEGGHEQK